jgi:hypothetical protein
MNHAAKGRGLGFNRVNELRKFIRTLLQKHHVPGATVRLVCGNSGFDLFCGWHPNKGATYKTNATRASILPVIQGGLADPSSLHCTSTGQCDSPHMVALYPDLSIPPSPASTLPCSPSPKRTLPSPASTLPCSPITQMHSPITQTHSPMLSHHPNALSNHPEALSHALPSPKCTLPSLRCILPSPQRTLPSPRRTHKLEEEELLAYSFVYSYSMQVLCL